MILPVIGLVLGLLVGALVSSFIAVQRERRALEIAETSAARTIRRAGLEKEAVYNAAQGEADEHRKHAASELEERRERLSETEDRLSEKGDRLDRKAEGVGTLERRLGFLEDEVEGLRASISESETSMLQRLSEISGTSTEQAGQEVLEMIERGLREDAQARMRESEADVKERADEIARKLLTDTAQRLSSPSVSVSPGSSIVLTERDLRKVTAAPDMVDTLAEMTGVAIAFNEEGTTLRISGPDAVKRELARVSLTEILKSRRTSPHDLERLVQKQEQRMEKAIRDAAIAAVRRAGVERLPDPIIETFGRLQYRYSYGQNQLLHAVETSHLAAILAHEMGADIRVARAGGLLHDLGKAIDREVEGTHAEIGGRLALEAGMDPLIAHCISAHHEEIDPETTEALITIVADAMSGARPGARRESLENYLGRLEAIESVAKGFPGVEKCYAIQAGRELRVLVNPDEVDDQGASRIATAISERIQNELEYPGQIKVMVIRETRTVEHTH